MKKIKLGKKLFHMANAMAHGVRPKRYECKFMAPGLTNYPGEDGNGDEMWLLSRDMMNKMQDSFIGCPVVSETKHNGDSSPDNFKEVAVGVISDIYTDNEGWDCAKFIVWDEDTQDAIEGQGFNVSCAYNTLAYDPGGVMNAIDYDHEVTDAEYIHLAIVSAPRQTGARIFTNSLDNNNTGVIEFDCEWEGKMGKLKLYPNGRKMFNADEELSALKKDLQEAQKKGDKSAVADIQSKIDGLTKKSVAPEGWEKTVEEMKKKPEIEEPFALAYWMQEKGYKPNEADIDKGFNEYKECMANASKAQMEEFKELKKTLPAGDAIEKMAKKYGWQVVQDLQGGKINANGYLSEEVKKTIKGMDYEEAIEYVSGAITGSREKAKQIVEEVRGKQNKEDDDMKKNKAIDLKNAVISTPNGDVLLKDMINAYETVKKNQEEEKKKEEEKKNAKWAVVEEGGEFNVKGPEGNLMWKKGSGAKTREEAEKALKEFQAGNKNLSMEDEYEGVKVSEMYEAYKKNQEKDEEAKKNAEEEAAKKNDDRKEALKSEGKTDEEIASIMKAEAEKEEEETKKMEEEASLKSAEEEAKKSKEDADKKTNHFNSLKKAREGSGEKKEPTRHMTRKAKIEAAKTEY